MAHPKPVASLAESQNSEALRKNSSIAAFCGYYTSCVRRRQQRSSTSAARLAAAP